MAKPKHVLQPARGIVDLLGGGRKVAKLLSIAPSTVTRWASAKEGNGVIPARHWRRLMAAASEQGILLTADSFLPGGEKSAT